MKIIRLIATMMLVVSVGCYIWLLSTASGGPTDKFPMGSEFYLIFAAIAVGALGATMLVLDALIVLLKWVAHAWKRRSR